MQEPASAAANTAPAASAAARPNTGRFAEAQLTASTASASSSQPV